MAAAASASSAPATASLLLLMVLLALSMAPAPADAVTLKEAQQQPEIYIHYDTDLFNIGVHCGASLVTMYGILCLIWLVITAYVALSGQERKRRSYVDSPQRRKSALLGGQPQASSAPRPAEEAAGK